MVNASMSVPLKENPTLANKKIESSLQFYQSVCIFFHAKKTLWTKLVHSITVNRSKIASDCIHYIKHSKTTYTTSLHSNTSVNRRTNTKSIMRGTGNARGRKTTSSARILLVLALLSMLASTMAAPVRMSKAAERRYNKRKLSNRLSGIVNHQRTLKGKKRKFQRYTLSTPWWSMLLAKLFH